METSRLEESLQVLQNLTASLFTRMEPVVVILRHLKTASSIGAAAGFAIALFCTWRYLRVASTRRNSVKRTGESARPGTSSRREVDVAVGTATGASLSVSQAHRRGGGSSNVAATQSQTTLTDVVRRQLNGARKMTCQLLGVVVEEQSPEELQSHVTVRPRAVEVLREIGLHCDVFLMVRVNDDASESAVRSALESAGLFSSGSLRREQVLFCSSEAGKNSFVRQIEPEWHVDSSADTVSSLAKFVRHELHVVKGGAPSMGIANVVTCESLERYFGLQSVPNA